MIENYLDRIEEKTELRQNLIALRQYLKTEQGRAEWQKRKEQDEQVLMELLKHEDAKVRRNAALILGETGAQRALQAIFEAYEGEQQLFVRSAYLTALGHLDYRACLAGLRERLKLLMVMEMAPEDQKHLQEELKLLRELVLTMEASVKHHFTGHNVPSELILLTSPGFEQLTADALPQPMREKAKLMHGGVRLMTDRPGALLGLRTVKEILFRFCANPLPAQDCASVAAAVMSSGLLDYLQKRHDGRPPFYFRIDLRTRMMLNEKGTYVKRLAAQLEQLSGHRLQNSASNYECELRIAENKQGRYSVYLILHTYQDMRFAYRRHALATSMHPIRAAEIAALAVPYMGDEVSVLDPFCGTGTLLIERHRKKKAANMYGVDLYGKAIEMAKENASLAGVPIYLVNKDFAAFTHRYAYDELITELPAQSDRMTAEMLRQLYRRFIEKLPEWMKPSGQVIVCTTEEAWLRQLAERSGYLKQEAVYHLSGRRETALVIMQYLG